MCLIKYQSHTLIHNRIQWKRCNPEILKIVKFVEFWMRSKILLFAYELRWGWNHSNILKKLMEMLKIEVKGYLIFHFLSFYFKNLTLPLLLERLGAPHFTGACFKTWGRASPCVSPSFTKLGTRGNVLKWALGAWGARGASLMEH